MKGHLIFQENNPAPTALTLTLLSNTRIHPGGMEINSA